MLYMHREFKEGLDKTLTNSVIQAVELLKAMEEAYKKREVTLNNFSFIMEKHLLEHIRA